MQSRFYLFIAVFTLIFACQSNSSRKETVDSENIFEFAKQIELTEKDNQVIIKSGGKETIFKSEELPLSNCIVSPVAAIAYLSELDLLGKIIAVDQPKYIYNPQVHKNLEENKIEVIGNGSQLYVEKILELKPDVLFSISNPVWAKDHELLEKAGIKIIYLDEYLEENYQAKLEYLKLFAKLFDKEMQAENHIKKVQQSIEKIKTENANNQSNKEKTPEIILGMIYGDIWYMPGGESAQINLINEAVGKDGFNYAWKENSEKGAQHLSFEEVYSKAQNADVWINLGDLQSLQDMESSYPKYAWFKVFKEKNVYTLIGRKSKDNANDFFEGGLTRPDLIIRDLQLIIQNNQKENSAINDELYFFKKLE